MDWQGDFPEENVLVELLVPGISSELDLEDFLKDTEEKLKINANRIEQELIELQSKMGDSRSGERPPSPSECLQWFNLRMHSSTKFVNTGHQELMEFFRCLQHYLRSEEDGREELTLQILQNLSSCCGIYFPCTPSSTALSSSLCPQLTSSSMHLVHSVRDDSSLEIQEAWDDVRLQLRRYLLMQLSSNSTECSGQGQHCSLSISERIRCLQQLYFLYPDSEVLTYYQGLRSQFVQTLLHSAISSSPGGVTGFDRLSVGFRSLVPALTLALTEELNVLSRLIEPHVILGFVNAVYLNTVACELASLMEKESEMALRDNTIPCGKTKKYSSRSRATVAPMELPTQSRSFNMTAHQLRALTQLACSLLGFEDHVKGLVTNKTFIICTGEAPCVKGILKKTKEDLDTSVNSKKATTGPSLGISEAQVVEFDWRPTFKGLSPHMAHCVKVVLDDVCTRSLGQEEASHLSGNNSLTLTTIDRHGMVPDSNDQLKYDFQTYSERETPKMIAKFCGSIIVEMETFLPLAVACRDSPLLEVQSSYVEACGRAAFAMLGRLEERALEVPSSAPVKNLPALLATCIYIHQRLEHYHAVLKDLSTTTVKVHLTLLPIQKYQDAVMALRDQLTQYCSNICSTCILQDAESHHWADPKPLYEGERYSFAVQMWFYFLCGLRSDLWVVLPSQYAKDVLGQILSETLQVVVQRYARAKVSYKRHLQIRYDITAVLLYMEEFMWSVCESPKPLLHSSPSSVIADDWSLQIHSLCEQLLTILVIVTAPFTLLYRTFMTSPEGESMSCQSDRALHHWLNAVNPELFIEQDIEGGQVTSACHLRLLMSDPGYNPKMLLQLLLHRNCHLTHILLENSGICQESEKELSAENRKARVAFIVALFNIFTYLNHVPKALGLAFQPYLERAQLWEHLYTLAETTQKVPVVISCVRSIIIKTTNVLLTHLVTMVATTEEPRRALFKQDVPESVLAKIPKAWNYIPLEEKKKQTKTAISLAIEAMSFIFTNLPLVATSLPLPIRHLFRVAEKHLSQYARQLRLVGLLLWVLLNCLIRSLEDPDTLKQISGMSLSCEAKDHLALVAECLRASMGIQNKGVPKAIVHKVLQALEEKRPKWINMQLQKSRRLCSDSVSEHGRESSVALAELTEQKISLMLLEICHKAEGTDYLRQIYHIIRGNEELLMAKLSATTDSPSDSPPWLTFNHGRDDYLHASFHPLHQYNQIGRKRLDQRAVVDWAWDWARLLPAYQGMCQVTFKTLLANRWEMQNGAELEDNAMVQELQRAYFVCHPPEADETLSEQTQGGLQLSDKRAAQ